MFLIVLFLIKYGVLIHWQHKSVFFIREGKTNKKRDINVNMLQDEIACFTEGSTRERIYAQDVCYQYYKQFKDVAKLQEGINSWMRLISKSIKRKHFVSGGV